MSDETDDKRLCISQP